MRIQDRPLIDIYSDVHAGILETLQADVNLSEIEDITTGQRKNIGRMTSPSIWILPSPHNPEYQGGQTVQHDFTFDFVTLVHEVEVPEEGLRKAQNLALRVYDAMVRDRTLNGVVDDVRPLRVDPAYDMGEQTQLYWSAVQFSFRIKRRE